ncbi:methyl-accepting chemotaxis protein [Sporomusa acidovorans]|uniref:Methyl-accepting chemotaxis protein McpB n=1 Tax=Sporomusa acidovorans (strain ATCC 49682 / DSM 3132 / Mol) TaxID=1123286 RepID=A0ABZ3JB93_SPOA4|nr:HAMP domain-containing methyl-accepting chemotaxis protein [Sporomusa acidovorans]OZC21763.1 methyl-accepting chemotaxis protein McpB [Sporomusa acidovorans DSM 3132]SDD57602.1 methyl-accepting chemotaxis protein [Sporomusa acidovorans]
MGIVALDEMLKTRIEGYEKIRSAAIAVAVAVFLLVLYLLRAFYLSVKDTVAKLAYTATLVADGDLTARVELQTHDELSLVGKAFNKMTQSLHEIVNTVYQTVDQMSGASREIAAATAETSESIGAVAESIQQVALDAENGGQSLGEASRVLSSLAALVQTAKEQAVATAAEADATLQAAAKGRTTSEEAMARMADIKAKMLETEGLMNSLNDYLTQIRLINEMITDIAHQTNLLALNAAIEAARAGVHGRGFAVVAEEVRKLAEQSNQGASEVTAIIAKIAQGTAAAVLAAQQSRAEVESGVNAVNQVGQALADIVAAARRTQDNVHAIVRNTDEEVVASAKIVKLTESIATGITNTAKQSQAVSAATEETNATMETIVIKTKETGKTAQQLQQVVSGFKI